MRTFSDGEQLELREPLKTVEAAVAHGSSVVHSTIHSAKCPTSRPIGAVIRVNVRSESSFVSAAFGAQLPLMFATSTIYGTTYAIQPYTDVYSCHFDMFFDYVFCKNGRINCATFEDNNSTIIPPQIAYLGDSLISIAIPIAIAIAIPLGIPNKSKSQSESQSNRNPILNQNPKRIPIDTQSNSNHNEIF